MTTLEDPMDIPISEQAQVLIAIDEHDREVKQSVLAYLAWHSGQVLMSDTQLDAESRADIIDDYCDAGKSRLLNLEGFTDNNHRTLYASSLRKQVREAQSPLMPICYLDVEAILSELILPRTQEEGITVSLPQAIESSGLGFSDYADFRQAYNRLGQHLITTPKTALFMLQKYQKEFLDIADPHIRELSRFHTVKPEWYVVNAPCHTERDFTQVSYASDVGKLVKIRGQVVERGDVRAILSHVAFRCITTTEYDEICGTVVLVEQNDEENQLMKPHQCDVCGGKQFTKLDSSESRTEALQRIVLQEEVLDGESKSIMVETRGTLVNKVQPGSTVEVTGIVSLEALSKNNLVCTQFVAGKSITETSSQDTDVSLSEADREEVANFVDSASMEERMQTLIDSWTGHIHSSEDIKKTIMLQNCTAASGSKFGHRRGIHILLVGDPGTAKTKFLLASTQLNPGSRYIDASTTTAAGLTGGCDRVEDMYTGKSQWALVPGALGLTAAAGTCSVDELNLYKGDLGDFNTALETGEVPVTKIIKGTIPTPCSVLAGANPAGKDSNRKKFQKGIDTPYANQIGFDHTQLQRFDVILIMEDEADVENDEKIALSMLFDATEDDDEAVKIRQSRVPLSFIQKYLAVAREQEVKITKEAAKYIAKNHASKRDSATGDDDLRSHRSVASIMRLTMAVARFDMTSRATLEHVKYAESILANSLQERDPGVIDGGQNEADRTRSKYIESFLLEFLKERSLEAITSGGLKGYPSDSEAHLELIKRWNADNMSGKSPQDTEVKARLMKMANSMPHLDSRGDGTYSYIEME